MLTDNQQQKRDRFFVSSGSDVSSARHAHLRDSSRWIVCLFHVGKEESDQALGVVEKLRDGFCDCDCLCEFFLFIIIVNHDEHR
jgi:hypothetical protein